jgi:hypothetical protein
MDGRVPAGVSTLRRVAAELAEADGGAHPWLALQLVSGLSTSPAQHEFANRAYSLARYDRAATLRGLVIGLERAKREIAGRLLRDRGVELTPLGRGDIEAGRVNVRVLVVLRYLRFRFGEVTVSCLVSGHRLYARPGVISAHIYGLAADVSALGGVPIQGHEQPGSVTERAVRSMLRLPAEVRPQQIISLLGLGGPSFPQADHYDHIHVGF